MSFGLLLRALFSCAGLGEGLRPGRAVWRAGSFAALALWLLAPLPALGSDVRPLPSGAPQQVVASGLRLHVIAHEDLDPDALRALARPGTTLWLRTRSNTLRESTIDTLAQFDGAWVELRPPLEARTLSQLARAPAAGLWLRLGEKAAPPPVRPGPRRVAVSLAGPLGPERAAAIAALSPAVVDWRAGAHTDLLAWGLFKNLPGKLLFRPDADAVTPVDCARPGRQSVAVAVHVALLISLGTDAFPCGKGARIQVSADTESWVLQAVHLRDPSAELEIEVGVDLARVRKARKLLDALGLTPRGAH